MLAQDLLVVMRAVFAAAVGMVTAALGWPAQSNGHFQRPALNAHRGQQPALLRPGIADVSGPILVRSVCVEVPFQIGLDGWLFRFTPILLDPAAQRRGAKPKICGPLLARQPAREGDAHGSGAESGGGFGAMSSLICGKLQSQRSGTLPRQVHSPDEPCTGRLDQRSEYFVRVATDMRRSGIAPRRFDWPIALLIDAKRSEYLHMQLLAKANKKTK